MSGAADLLTSGLSQAILESINDPVQVLDRGYRVVWSNTFNTEKRTWRPKDLVLGKVCHREFFGRETPCPDCPITGTFATGRASVREKMIPMPEGGHAWRRVHSWPIPGPDGLPRFVVKLGFIITHDKQEKARMERYVGRLESAVNPGEAAPMNDGLTPRQQQVLSLLSQGFSNPEIAHLLGLSPHTIKTHVTHIFEKLGVEDRVTAAATAARLGMV